MKVLSSQGFPISKNSTAFWKVPSLRPFVLLVRAAIMEQWWNDTDRGNRSTERKSCPNVNFSTTDPTMDYTGIELGPTQWQTGAKPASCRGLTCRHDGLLLRTAKRIQSTWNPRGTLYQYVRQRTAVTATHKHDDIRIFKSLFTAPFLPTIDFIPSYGCSWENAVLLYCHSAPQL